MRVFYKCCLILTVRLVETTQDRRDNSRITAPDHNGPEKELRAVHVCLIKSDLYLTVLAVPGLFSGAIVYPFVGSLGRLWGNIVKIRKRYCSFS